MGFYSSGPKIKENDIKVKAIEYDLSLLHEIYLMRIFFSDKFSDRAIFGERTRLRHN